MCKRVLKEKIVFVLVIAIGLSPAASVLAVPQVLAHWPMDEGEGTLVADVVGGNDGTMVGLDPAAAWIADGALGGAVLFDNIDGHHIEVPHSDALDFGERLEAIKQRASDLIRHLIQLAVVFVLQTGILPIAFLWIFLQLFKQIFRIDSGNKN